MPTNEATMGGGVGVRRAFINKSMASASSAAMPKPILRSLVKVIASRLPNAAAHLPPPPRRAERRISSRIRTKHGTENE